MERQKSGCKWMLARSESLRFQVFLIGTTSTGQKQARSTRQKNQTRGKGKPFVWQSELIYCHSKRHLVDGRCGLGTVGRWWNIPRSRGWWAGEKQMRRQEDRTTVESRGDGWLGWGDGSLGKVRAVTVWRPRFGFWTFTYTLSGFGGLPVIPGFRRQRWDPWNKLASHESQVCEPWFKSETLPQ